MIFQEDELAHYGTPRHSGRYPWGSGGDVATRNADFITMMDGLKAEGLTDRQISEAMGFAKFDKDGKQYSSGTTEWRAQKSISLNAQKAEIVSKVVKLKATGMGDSAIARELGLKNESTVRSYLQANSLLKVDRLQGTVNMLREAIDAKEFVDVGAGVEHYLGVSANVLRNAVAVLRQEGYGYHKPRLPQLGTAHLTTYRIMTKPGVHSREVYKNADKIDQIAAWSPDGGRTYKTAGPPQPISSKRVAVRWGEQGGAESDGVIYLRRGVKDLDMGGSNYAQVRILVDGTHYLKGMAMYKDDLPKGIDIEFNTNKRSDNPDMAGKKLNALKKVNPDPETPPWNAIIRPNGQRGALNIVNEEGHWDVQKANFSSQFLSKQSKSLAKSQLNMTYERKKMELDEIMALTNPTVRKKLLEELADSVNTSAVHLEAAALPKSSSHVILPVNSIKEGEIYAPKYLNGDRVALIRHPHGGPFEIPVLTVNNKNAEAKKKIGSSAQDAVGIHSKVAEKLSGADFDGDNVIVVRNNKGLVNAEPSLEGLKNFDPKAQYPKYPGMRLMQKQDTQIEMGKISNLITDMTIKGAPTSEIVQAVRHSMVVIDAEKHELNYKLSEKDNNVLALKRKWQGSGNAGAATIISRAKKDLDVPERAQGFRVDPATGKRIFRNTNAPDFVSKKTGKTIKKTTKVQWLDYVDDAHTLSSGTPIEKIYADHSNRLKALANTIRKEAANTKGIETSPSAKSAYAVQVATLKAKLQHAQKNAPLERQAQIVGNAIVRQKRQANPDMDKDVLKKVKSDALETARYRTGAYKNLVKITQPEWDAIQAGAVSPSMLTDILKNTDPTDYKLLATPKTRLLMTNTKVARAKAMLMNGYTQAEVAEQLGVSLTTLKTSLKKEE